MHGGATLRAGLRALFVRHGGGDDDGDEPAAGVAVPLERRLRHGTGCCPRHGLPQLNAVRRLRTQRLRRRCDATRLSAA